MWIIFLILYIIIGAVLGSFAKFLKMIEDDCTQALFLAFWPAVIIAVLIVIVPTIVCRKVDLLMHKYIYSKL